MNRPLAIVAFAVVSFVGLSAREQGQTREFTISGSDHRYSPARIEVNRDDLVKITFTAVDMPHSFNNERYRIAKRAGAGQSVTFEFRADQAGTFEFYCNLKQDERCRDMKGTLVVRVGVQPQLPASAGSCQAGRRSAVRLQPGRLARSAQHFPRRRDPLLCGRMRVEQQERRARRMLLGQVLRRHPAHGADERRRLRGRLQRKSIGPALVSARPGVQQRRRQQQHAGHAQHHHRQTGHVGS